MGKRLLLPIFVIVAAFGVLLISILRTASVKHSFTAPVSEINLEEELPEVDYYLPYEGTIIPGTLLWPAKAARDRVWISVVADNKKAEINLLFADKRLVYAQRLVEDKNFELGAVTLEKAEGYLQNASQLEEEYRLEGQNTIFLSKLLAQAALKHIEITNIIIENSPEDARPYLLEIKKIPIEVYNAKSNYLKTQGFYLQTYPFQKG